MGQEENSPGDPPRGGSDCASENGDLPETTYTPSVKSQGASTKAPCVDVRIFLVNMCFLSIFSAMSITYNVGVMRTLERKFDLRSSETGLIMARNDISHIIVVTFVGYFGGRAHKPKVMSSFLVLMAVAAFMMASPALFYQDIDAGSSQMEPMWNTTSDVGTHVCRHGNASSADDCETGSLETRSVSRGPYYIFLAAQFVAGLGGCSTHTLSIAYLDENTTPEKSSLYLGNTEHQDYSNTEITFRTKFQRSEVNTPSALVVSCSCVSFPLSGVCHCCGQK